VKLFGYIVTPVLLASCILMAVQIESLQARVTELEAAVEDHEGYHMAGGDPPFIETRRTVTPRVR